MASQKIRGVFAVVSRVAFILASQSLALPLKHELHSSLYTSLNPRKTHDVKRGTALDVITLWPHNKQSKTCSIFKSLSLHNTVISVIKISNYLCYIPSRDNLCSLRVLTFCISNATLFVIAISIRILTWNLNYRTRVYIYVVQPKSSRNLNAAA
jgi:hypothetical protein